MNSRHNLYSTACAYIEYYGAAEASGQFEDETGEDSEQIKEVKVLSLGRLALWPEAAYARFRLRIRAEALGVDTSSEGLMGLAADIKKDTEDDLYSSLPTIGSSQNRGLLQAKLDEVDQGKCRQPIDIAIQQILRQADKSGARADAALDVRGYGR